MSDDKTMEQHAYEHARSLEGDVQVLRRLQEIDEFSELEESEIEAVTDALGVFPSHFNGCDQCGRPLDEHPTTDADGEVCVAYETDIDDLRDEVREALEARNYGAGLEVMIDVQMYGGGPAGGVEFRCHLGGHGLEPISARVWHQDWFQPRGYAPLDADVMDELWDIWYLEGVVTEL